MAGNANLTITIDKKSIANQIVDGFNTASKEIEAKTITYNVAADENQVKELVARIEKLTPEVRAGVAINFDTKQFETRMQELKNFSGKSAKEIGKEFSNEISKAVPKNITEKKLAEQIFGKGSKKEFSGIVSELNKEFKNFEGFDIKEASYDDIKNYTILLERTKIALNGLKKDSKGNFNPISSMSTKMLTELSNKVNTDLSNIYDNIGINIETKVPRWITDLENLAKKDFSNIISLLNALKEGIPTGGNGGFGGLGNPNLTKQIEEQEAALEEAEKKAKEYRDSLETAPKLDKLKENIRKAFKEYDNWGNDSKKNKKIDENFQNAVQEYVRYGGKFSRNSTEDVDFVESYNATKDTNSNGFIKIKEIQSIKKAAEEANAEVERLTESLAQLKSSGTTGTTTPSSPAPSGETGTPVDNAELERQTQIINELNQQLTEAQSKIADMTEKYKEQENIIVELKKAEEKLKGFNDPKILESDEYKKIQSDLKTATKDAEDFKQQLDNANEQLSGLQSKIGEYQNGNVVPSSDFQAEVDRIQILTDIVDDLRIKLDDAEQTIGSFENKVTQLNTVISGMESDKTASDSTIEQQNEQISNLQKINAELEEGKKKYDEIINKIDEIEKKQRIAMNSTDISSTFNNAKQNIDFNQGKGTPDGFVKFDYLEQVNKKMQQTKVSQDDLIKSAVYYNQYLAEGGTERIFDKAGEDVTEELISEYEMLSKMVNENGRISEESAIRTVKSYNKELLALTQEKEELEKTNKELEKKIELEQEAAKVNAAMNNKSKISKKKTPTSSNKDDEKVGEQRRQQLVRITKSSLTEMFDNIDLSKYDDVFNRLLEGAITSKKAIEEVVEAEKKLGNAVKETGSASGSNGTTAPLSREEVQKIEELLSKLDTLRTNLSQGLDMSTIQTQISTIRTDIEALLSADLINTWSQQFVDALSKIDGQMAEVLGKIKPNVSQVQVSQNNENNVSSVNEQVNAQENFNSELEQSISLASSLSSEISEIVKEWNKADRFNRDEGEKVFERSFVVGDDVKIHGAFSVGGESSTLQGYRLENEMKENGIKRLLKAHSHPYDIPAMSFYNDTGLGGDLSSFYRDFIDGVRQQLIIGLQETEIFDAGSFFENLKNDDVDINNFRSEIVKATKEFDDEYNENYLHHLYSYFDAFKNKASISDSIFNTAKYDKFYNINKKDIYQELLSYINPEKLIEDMLSSIKKDGLSFTDGFYQSVEKQLSSVNETDNYSEFQIKNAREDLLRIVKSDAANIVVNAYGGEDVVVDNTYQYAFKNSRQSILQKALGDYNVDFSSFVKTIPNSDLNKELPLIISQLLDATDAQEKFNQARKENNKSNETTISSPEQPSIPSAMNEEASQVNSTVELEKTSLGELATYIKDTVIPAIQAKTQEFANEANLVDSYVSNEIESLYRLSSTLEGIAQQTSGMPKIELDINTELLNEFDSNKLEVLSNLKNNITGLNLEELDNLASILKSLGNTNLAKNIQNVANAILNLKSNLNNITNGSTDFIKDLSSIAKQAQNIKTLVDALQNNPNALNNIKNNVGAQQNPTTIQNIKVSDQEDKDIRARIAGEQDFVDVLGDELNIIKQIRTVKGEQYESYKVSGKNGSITFGRSTQGNGWAYNPLNASVVGSDDYTAKQAADRVNLQAHKTAGANWKKDLLEETKQVLQLEKEIDALDSNRDKEQLQTLQAQLKAHRDNLVALEAEAGKYQDVVDLSRLAEEQAKAIGKTREQLDQSKAKDADSVRNKAELDAQKAIEEQQKENARLQKEQQDALAKAQKEYQRKKEQAYKQEQVNIKESSQLLDDIEKHYYTILDLKRKISLLDPNTQKDQISKLEADLSKEEQAQKDRISKAIKYPNVSARDIKSRIDSSKKSFELNVNAETEKATAKSNEKTEKEHKNYNAQVQKEEYDALSKSIQEYIYWLKQEASATEEAKIEMTSFREAAETQMNEQRQSIASAGLIDKEKELEIDYQILKVRRELNAQQIKTDSNEQTKNSAKAYTDLNTAIKQYNKYAMQEVKSTGEAKEKLTELKNEARQLVDTLYLETLNNPSIFDDKKNIASIDLIKKGLNDIEITIAKLSQNRIANVDDAWTEAEKINSALNSTSQMMSGFENSNISGVSEIAGSKQEEIDKLNQKLIDGKITNEQYAKSVEKIKSELNSIEIVTDVNDNIFPKDKLKEYAKSLTDSSYSLKKFDKINNRLTYTYNDSKDKIREVTLEYNSMTGAISRVSDTTKSSTSLLSNFMSALTGKWQEVIRYVLSFASFYQVWGWIKQGVGYVRELDTALTEMRKVSDETLNSLKNFQKVSFDIADSVGSTAKQIQNSAADFMGLGYNLDEASKLAKDASIYANVGDMDISESTEHMISSIKAWGSEFSNEVEASSAIIDKYNEIGL